jgi:hypothetical protein
VPEICDGKDNDCVGEADEAAPCPDEQGCADGECTPRCGRPGDADCAADRLCREGLCRFVECVRTPCSVGFRCDPKRGCVDRCEGVDCPNGIRCVNGECTSCLLGGCAAGEVCQRTSLPPALADDRCVPNPCTAQICGGGQYCRNGVCVPGCTGVSCGRSEVCRDGTCVADACAGRACARGEYCDSNDGVCHRDPCASISCLPGLACVPGQALCIADPCAVTICGAGQICQVRPDGVADCRVAREVSAGGTGCGCVIGAADAARRSGSSGVGWSSLLLLALLGLRRRAGRRR